MRTFADYLTSLTVPTLREIAEQGNVKIPSKARKGDIVILIDDAASYAYGFATEEDNARSQDERIIALAEADVADMDADDRANFLNALYQNLFDDFLRKARNRLNGYRIQNGQGRKLTPAQARRTKHKVNAFDQRSRALLSQL